MVWNDGCIFLKPLPAFLLCQSFWQQHLCGRHPGASELHSSGVGLLLSYTWLIQYPTDFQMARNLSLLPDGFDFAAWTKFVADFISHVDLRTLAQVNRRYHYGELRLTRLNAITRFFPSFWSAKNLVYGHMNFSTRYKTFFDSNFGWLLATFAYVSVILSAIQAGLGTNFLSGSDVFQKMSYIVSVAALVAAFASALWLTLIFVFLLVYHLSTTFLFMQGIESDREKE